MISPSILQPGLGRIGKVRLGYRDPAKKGAPTRLDHFRISNLEIGAGELPVWMPDLENKIANVELDSFGRAQPPDHLVSIPVIFLFDDPAKDFQYSLADYSPGKCFCRGEADSEDINKMLAFRRPSKSKNTEKEVTILEGAPQPYGPCPCERLTILKTCKPMGRLLFILPVADVVGSAFEFRTTSWRSVRNLSSSLQMLATITHGHLAGLPLHLVCRMERVEDPSGKARSQSIANVEWRGDLESLFSKAKEIAMLRAQTTIEIRQLEIKAERLLAVSEPEDEEADLAGEFYPSNGEASSVESREAYSADLPSPAEAGFAKAGAASAAKARSSGNETEEEPEIPPELEEPVEKPKAAQKPPVERIAGEKIRQGDVVKEPKSGGVEPVQVEKKTGKAVSSLF